jgi:glycosyltransferase involved in cell wall biosynthesis
MSDLISCLMVTAGGAARWDGLARSIRAFRAQTYARRELVVVLDAMPDADAGAIRAHCRALRDPRIRVVRPRGARSLGALRNAAVDAARGAVVCQWDDDDLHHPDRLAGQVAALERAGRGAVYLRGALHLLAPYRAVYWVDVVQPATLMAYRRDLPRFPVTGLESRWGEARAVEEELDLTGRRSVLRGAPFLYTYVFHGGNTIAFSQRVGSLDRSVSHATLVRHGARMRRELARVDYDWTGVELVSPRGVVGAVA